MLGAGQFWDHVLAPDLGNLRQQVETIPMMTRSSDDGGYMKHQQAVIEVWQLDRSHFAFTRLTKYSSRSIIAGKSGLAHSRANHDQL